MEGGREIEKVIGKVIVRVGEGREGEREKGQRKMRLCRRASMPNMDTGRKGLLFMFLIFRYRLTLDLKNLYFS